MDQYFLSLEVIRPKKQLEIFTKNLVFVFFLCDAHKVIFVNLPAFSTAEFESMGKVKIVQNSVQ